MIEVITAESVTALERRQVSSMGQYGFAVAYVREIQTVIVGLRGLISFFNQTLLSRANEERILSHVVLLQQD